jgi:spore germination protein YaaH
LKHCVPALLISLALTAFHPGDAFAAQPAPPSPGGDAAHPLVMQQASAQVSGPPVANLQPFQRVPRSAAATNSNPSLQREVFGFGYLNASLEDPNLGFRAWNLNLLSTVAVFGLHVQSDGTFANDTAWSYWNSSAITDLLNAAAPSGTKVVVTIVLQDFSAGTPAMCAGLANRATTVAETAHEVSAKGVAGVNIDYEGLQGTCANGENPQADLTDLARQMRAAMPGSYISIDTYASSAGDPSGFMNIPNLKPYVDSFFVMAYDSDWSNYYQAPLYCRTYCLNPVSPLSGYFYNDTRAATEYAAAVPASQVILGLPWYGRWACVNAVGPNQYPVGGQTYAISYRAAAGIPSDPTNSNYTLHRDATDGVSPWSTWNSSSSPACTIEMYWDDPTSMGAKFDLVNRTNLRGVGIWNLTQGGNAQELWSTISTYFACPATLSPPGSPATTEFSIPVAAGSCSVAYFDFQQFDSTSNQGWYPIQRIASGGSTGTAVVDGYPGFRYQFRVRAHSTGGVTSAWAQAGTTVATTATYSHPWRGLYTLDGYGGMHPADSPPLSDSAYWGGWSIARAAHGLPGGPQSGLVLDGYGGLHPYGAPGLTESGTDGNHRWGWDIARDFAFLPDGSGGLVLDGYGGLHPFLVNGNTHAAQVTGAPYWGWDIARKVVIFPDGSGGYVLDGWGGIHPFGINGPVPSAASSVAVSAYWPNWDIARDLVLVPGNGGQSGYVLDGYGGIHAFHPANDGSTQPPAIAGARWGVNIARSLLFLPGSAGAGYTMDGWGGFHPFGGAPPIVNSAYWPNWDIARVAWIG